MFGCDRECVVLGVGGIERDLCGLDVADDVEGSIVLADAERDGELATASDRVDSESSVTGHWEIDYRNLSEFIGKILIISDNFIGSDKFIGWLFSV